MSLCPVLDFSISEIGSDLDPSGLLYSLAQAQQILRILMWSSEIMGEAQGHGF